MNKTKIELPFRGKRKYIQGADLYNTIINEVSDRGTDIQTIRFSVHGFIRKNTCLLYAPEKLSEIQSLPQFPAQFRCKMAGKEHYLFIGEDESAPNLEKRIPYDEKRIHDLCHIADTSISIPVTSPFSFMETIVSMKKRLMWELFPKADGQWVFTKVLMNKQFECPKELTVQLAHNMELKLVKSRILYESQQIGTIFFSLVKA